MTTILKNREDVLGIVEEGKNLYAERKVYGLLLILEGVAERALELEDAIRKVLAQKGDDLCWLDVYRDLGTLVGVPFEPTQIPREQFLANCARYDESLRGGRAYERKG